MPHKKIQQKMKKEKLEREREREREREMIFLCEKNIRKMGFLFQNFGFSQPYLSLTHTLIIYLSFTMLYIPMHILDTITHHLQQKI